MSGINYSQLLATAQTGDLLLYSDFVAQTQNHVYSLVMMIIRDPFYLDPNMTGLYIVTSSKNSQLGLYGCELFQLPTTMGFLQTLGGTLYYRELRRERDTLWQTLLVKAMISAVYFPRSRVDEVHYIASMFYQPGSIYVKKPEESKASSHLIAYLYLRLGVLPVGIPWTVLEPRDFSYDQGYQLPFTDCNLLPERMVDFA